MRPEPLDGGQLRVVAAREIAAGEELTIDYVLHTTNAAWRMTCLCGSPGCRRTIRGDDWRRPEFQERYRGHWPPAMVQLVAADAS